MTSTVFKPLLAATLEPQDFDKVTFPKVASPKLDGIRVLIKDGVAITRNIKPVRNKYVQSILGTDLLNGLDGEIIVGDPTDKLCYRSTNSGVMSSDGEPDFRFYIFDNHQSAGGWNERIREALAIQGKAVEQLDRFIVLESKVVNSIKELEAYEQECLELGYEGIMLRDPEGVYKNGRSTFKEQILLKLKRFTDFEAVITGFVERMHNANEATTNALGHTERSMHKANMIGRGDLGALMVTLPGDGETTGSAQQFTVGSGFTDEERREIWNNQEKYLGMIVKLRAFNYGGYDLPRFPTYTGLREDL